MTTREVNRGVFFTASAGQRLARRGSAVALAGLLAWTAATTSGSAQGANPFEIQLTVLGTYHTDVFDAAAAEIVAHDPATQRLFVVNAAAATVEVLDIRVASSPVKLFDIVTPGLTAADGSVIPVGASANSVAVRDGVVAVAVQSSDKTDNGWVAFFTTGGTFLNAVRVGALPDMVAFTPNGQVLLVANEGEPADDFSSDPEGSVSVIDLSGSIAALTQAQVRTADFRAWDTGEQTLHPDVRIFGPDLSTGEPGTPGRIARNLEPEYVITAAPASKKPGELDHASRTAWVVLQEANAVAILDIATATFVDIRPFGVKDHLLPGNELDVSDQSGAIRIANWPVYGMYLPDGSTSYSVQGRTYLVTANEGDAREWGDYVEISRFRALSGAIPLCADSPRLQAFLASNDQGITTFEQLRDNTHMGRLNVTTEKGLRADGSCYEDVYTLGGRSFSIWDAETGALVFDSGAEFEHIIASLYPANFNSNHTDNSFKTRSDDKGPEPEGVVIGRFGQRYYAFIGLERMSGVMVYDVTNPAAPFFVQYLNNRNFSGAPGTRAAGDLGAEGLIFIEAQDSPTFGPLLVVANEVSGTTTIYGFTKVPQAPR